MNDRLESLVLATITGYTEILFGGMQRKSNNLLTEVSLLFRDELDQLHSLPVLRLDGYDYWIEPNGNGIRSAIRAHIEAFLSSRVSAAATK